MRFRTRTFLICFLPFVALLASSFWMMQRLVQETVREGLRASLRANQMAMAQMHAKSDVANHQFLKIAGENPSLKAGLQLLLLNRRSEDARRTVEDQLRELGEHMSLDFLLVSGPNGQPLAAVLRAGVKDGHQRGLDPVSADGLITGMNGIALIDGHPFHVGSVPIDSDHENIGTLEVGAPLDLTVFGTPIVLMHEGRVVESNLTNVPLSDLSEALQSCSDAGECDLRLNGARWLSLPLQPMQGDSRYALRSLENLDAAMAPVQKSLRRLFLAAALLCLFVALACSVFSARSIVRPVASIVHHLRKAAHTGELAEFSTDLSPILEVRALAESYNHAAASVRQAREDLQSAYVQFIGSLAQALDARDGYTAGHSNRVSDLSCAMAAAMNLSGEDIERIRIGALLHDIGKIGVADHVLQKPGRLTEEEFEQVKQHPVIGRRILEGVQGFAVYLPAVELHHENWNGTGYPRGQRGEETPVDARIIHVADAYDAITTDRSYRQGRSHETALRILRENAGTQFDPRVVAILEGISHLLTASQPQQQLEDEGSPLVPMGTK
jgi:HD-GYP domain-containing protein (c-di-GMP phosphodiesterase class II)